MFKKIFIALIFYLCVSGALFANTYGKQDVQALGSNNSNAVDRFDPQGSIIDPVFQSSHYQIGDTINVDFVVESQHTATSHNYSVDGFTVVSVNRVSNIVNAKISYISSYENATFSLLVGISNGNTLSANIFAVKTNHGVFISQNSFEDAKERAYSYMIDNNYMTFAEREAARSINNQNGITQILPQFSPFSNNITGRMTWREDTRSGNNNNTYPLQFIRIEFRNSAQTLLETTYTDVNGNYSSNITPTGQINIRVYAAGLQNGSNDNVRVIRDNNGGDYFHEALNINYSASYNLEFDMTTNLGQAFQISQAAITAARYAQAMRGSLLTNVPIVYPHSQTGCSYAGATLGSGNGTIRIGSSTAVNFSVRTYSSWDVVMHEYGHHVQYQSGFNIYGSSTGASVHNLTGNLIDDYSYTKDHGTRLAWRESWPTVFGSMAQQYYVNLGQLDSRIVTVGDAKYESYNGANLDFVNMSSSTPKGEASESGVIGTLWCVYSSTGKSYDNITGIGHQSFWNLITGNTVLTFSDFANLFYTTYPQQRSEFGQILAYFRMAPSSVTNTAVTATTPPTFSWTGNGGGTSTTAQNNRYTVVFYNGNTEIFRTATITNTSTGTITHTLSTSDWNAVLNAAGSTIKVCIMAEQTSTPLTGGYFSQAVLFAKPAVYAFTTVTNSTGLTITGVTGNPPSNLEIPARINGTLVTQIGNGSSTVSGLASVTNITFATDSGVTTIAANAFSGLIQLSQISIPASITSIGSNAFENCTSLTNVTLPNSLTTIESSAFKGCSNLSSITIPNSVTSIGNSVLSGCSNLTSITIPFVGQSRTATGNDAKFNYIFGTIPNQLRTVIIASGTNLPQEAFYNCSNLTSISLPDTVTSIGSNAFTNCTSLTSITIPYSVTSIGNSVLSGCSGLTSISIPFVGKSRTAIDDEAKFGYLFGSIEYTGGDIIDQNGITYYIPIFLEDVEITSGTNIPEDAFYNYYWLENITLPNTLTSIGSNAFYNCYWLTSITIPNTVTNIGPNAFYYCLSLTSLTIPDSVTSIGSSAFGMCSHLQSISVPFVGQRKTATGNDAKFVYIFGTLPNQLKVVEITDITTIPQDAFYNCSHLTSISLLSPVTSIGSNAFYGCSSLTSFTIPSTVTSIGSNAFYYCLSLISITIPSSLTSLGSNVFYGCTHLSSLSYHVVVTTSGYYNIQIDNISSVSVKIDGVTNYFPNDIKQKFLTSGNHTILAECANIGTMVSFPIIEATEYIPYYIDIDNIYIVFYDGPEMQYATYVVSSLFYQAYNFDLINRSITFTRISCEWELENLNYQEFHLVQMFIGENYYYENGGIYFECYDGYQISSNTWFYSATAYNITITFSQSEWDQNVHQL